MAKSTALVALTGDQASKRQRLEKTIANGIRTFHDVGSALIVMRDEKLYLSTHSTFEDYCQNKWGFERAHAYRLMDASKVVNTLQVAIGDRLPMPTHESQTRALKAAPEDKQAEIWERVVAESEGVAPDAGAIEKVVRKIVRASSPPAAKSTSSATSGWTKEDLKEDKELALAFANIEKVYGKQDTTAIQHGAIESMKRSDVLMLASLPAPKMKELQNLILGNHWTPKRALAFVNDMPVPTSTLEDMANWSLSRNGLFFEAQIDGFVHTCRAMRAAKR